MRRALVVAALLAPILATGRMGQTHAVLINGGHKPESNYESHIVHLEGMRSVLESRGVTDLTVFSADGDDPEADMAVREPFAHPHRWLLEGTDAEDLLPKTRQEDSPWEGPRQPAVSTALSGWFSDAPLSPGDTLLLYTTDHGWRDKETGEAGLWLWREKADPFAMATWLSALPDGVTTVMVMSHCYSGVFADVVLDGPLDGSVCGFFSAPKTRRAYGCYPEGRTSTSIGHGFRFIDALSGAESAAAAHERVLLSDRTPDVPLATSDLYLRRLVELDASAAGVGLAERVDALLVDAQPDPIIAAMAAGVGLTPPQSMAAVAALQETLQAAAPVVEQNDKLWSARLEELTEAHLGALRTDGGDSPTDATAMIDALLVRAEREGLLEMFVEVARRQQLADDVRWRMQVRSAVLLRTEALLIARAGEQLLATGRRMRPQRQVLRDLRRCEASPLGLSSQVSPPLPAAWPDLSVDLDAGLQPSFLGLRLENLPTEPGAVRVKSVLEGRPGEAAGLQADDVLIGPSGAAFVLPGQARVWAALLVVDEPVSVQIRREGVPKTITITPGVFPAPD